MKKIITIFIIFLSFTIKAEENFLTCNIDKTKMSSCPTPYELLLNKIHKKIVNTSSSFEESRLRSEILDALSSKHPRVLESLKKLKLELNEENALYYASIAHSISTETKPLNIEFEQPISALEVAEIDSEAIAYNQHDPRYSRPIVFDIDNDGTLELISKKILGTMRIDELVIWSRDGSTYKAQVIDETKITYNLQSYDWGNQGVLQYIATDFYLFKKKNIAANHIFHKSNVQPYCDIKWIKINLEKERSLNEYINGCQDKAHNKHIFEYILNHLAEKEKKRECIELYNQININSGNIVNPCQEMTKLNLTNKGDLLALCKSKDTHLSEQDLDIKKSIFTNKFDCLNDFESFLSQRKIQLDVKGHLESLEFLQAFHNLEEIEIATCTANACGKHYGYMDYNLLSTLNHRKINFIKITSPDIFNEPRVILELGKIPETKFYIEINSSNKQCREKTVLPENFNFNCITTNWIKKKPQPE